MAKYEDQALTVAATQGDLARAKAILERGASPNRALTMHKLRFYPLNMAAGQGHTEMCRLLIEHGAKVDKANGPRTSTMTASESGKTALHLASRNGHVETCQFLLEAGAVVDARDDEGMTPLHRAKDIETARTMLDAGADLHAKTLGGLEPIHTVAATVAENDKALIGWLLGQGADLEVRGEGWGLNTPLLHAAQYNNAVGVQALLEEGADIGAVNKTGNTALHLAMEIEEHVKFLNALHGSKSKHGLPNAAKVLIVAGADLAATNADGQTPLDRVTSGQMKQELEACIAAKQTADFERDTAAVLADDFNPNAAPDANAVPSDAEPATRRQRLRL